MALLAITVLGHDRPGIIADVTAALASREANVEDSSMTLLQGFFAWTLVVETEADPKAVASDLAFLESDELVVSVFGVSGRSAMTGPTRPMVISVHGADRVGIVSSMAAGIAGLGGNITDLQTRLGGGLFVVVAEADFPEQVQPEQVRESLAEVGRTVGVEVAVQPADTDVM